MIVIDSSAIIAILKNETEAAPFTEAVGRAERCFLSAVNYLEVCLVLLGRGPKAALAYLDPWIERAGIEVVAFDAPLATVAREASLRFGRGRHPAGLNLGDCAAYALAKSRDLPLLFKGADFPKTDIVPAIA